MSGEPLGSTSEAAPDLGDYATPGETRVSPYLNIREQIARIDRAIEENAKARVEAAKLSAERDKLAAEALKLARDRAIAPWQVAATAVAASAALVGASGEARASPEVALLGALGLLRVAGGGG